MSKIIIFVKTGIVQEVYCDDIDADVSVLDFDLCENKEEIKKTEKKAEKLFYVFGI
ncbi:MAG: hypothetical protein GY853_01565 [PVC group bacterium]|nr:hypothetical protein [PVC group bacterium]